MAETASTSVSDSRTTMTVSLARSASIAPPATVSSLLLASARSMHVPLPQLVVIAVDSDDPDGPPQLAASVSAPTAATPMPWSISRREQPHARLIGKQGVFIAL